jgi:phospholipase/carboxylesterase
MMTLARNADPHQQASLYESGVEPGEATGALILLHGRGGSAQDILSLGEALGLHGVSMFAPEAEGNTWYPNSFLAPIASNEPWLSSALKAVAGAIDQCVALGFVRERIAIAGFSQGACLACEFVARHPSRYAGLVAFTGGLIGPLGSDLHHAGNLEGTPILLSSGDPDLHVPWRRVEETAEQFTAMGAAVTLKKYLVRPHTIIPEEMTEARALLMPALAVS